jgi:hypothetical protein
VVCVVCRAEPWIIRTPERKVVLEEDGGQRVLDVCSIHMTHTAWRGSDVY